MLANKMNEKQYNELSAINSKNGLFKNSLRIIN